MPPHKPPPIPGDEPEELIREPNTPYLEPRFRGGRSKAGKGTVDLTRPFPWGPGDGTPREHSPSFQGEVKQERARRKSIGSEKGFKTSAIDEVRRKRREKAQLDLQKMLGPVKNETDEPMGISIGSGVGQVDWKEEMWGPVAGSSAGSAQGSTAAQDPPLAGSQGAD